MQSLLCQIELLISFILQLFPNKADIYRTTTDFLEDPSSAWYRHSLSGYSTTWDRPNSRFSHDSVVGNKYNAIIYHSKERKVMFVFVIEIHVAVTAAFNDFKGKIRNWSKMWVWGRACCILLLVWRRDVCSSVNQRRSGGLDGWWVTMNGSLLVLSWRLYSSDWERGMFLALYIYLRLLITFSLIYNNFTSIWQRSKTYISTSGTAFNVYFTPCMVIACSKFYSFRIACVLDTISRSQ